MIPQLLQNAHLLQNIYFSKCGISLDISLILNNEPIPWKKSYRYIGIHLDSKLTWSLHIQETQKKQKERRDPYLHY